MSEPRLQARVQAGSGRTPISNNCLIEIADLDGEHPLAGGNRSKIARNRRKSKSPDRSEFQCALIAIATRKSVSCCRT
ncbi:hypothetical protein LPU83_pLPU83d_0831 (plasmid) [Rhizobium favelukesii]|uniref:Uncharacterized protein n=1 Tax=Rhizobium favelukesii TaxID=348824 RepID=W6S7M6_9HYPH|nr:hypothetical protein LPU83_pLPU83d_0831 [Rhizobium favelukesii]